MNLLCKILFSFCCLVLAEWLSSCTLIGFGIGSLVDPNPTHDTVAIFHSIDDYSGQMARIHFQGDSMRYAKFTGYSDETAEQYQKSYHNYVRANSADPTAIAFGDTIVTQDFNYKGKFHGYFPEGIVIDEEKVYFENFARITFPRRPSKTELFMLYDLNEIPIRATLNFADSNGTFSLTNHDFDNVFIMPHKRLAPIIGLVIGAACDLAWIVVIVEEIAQSGGGEFASAHHSGGKPTSIGLKFGF